MSEILHYIMHIPKTAGMSLQALVRRRYKDPKNLRLIYTQKEVENGFEDSTQLKVIMGHFRFGFHRFSERPFSYSVFLRDPLQQIISHYGYTLDHPEKFEYLPDNINNIIDFAACPYGNNLQTRFVSGIDEPSAESLYQAKVNLLKYFDCIGITEEFDASIMLLGKTLGWKIQFYTNENRGQSRKQKVKVTQDQKAQLREMLQYDIELYAFAKQLFYNQLQKNPDVLRRLNAYKFQNRIFQKLNPAYIQLKNMLGLTRH